VRGFRALVENHFVRLEGRHSRATDEVTKAIVGKGGEEGDFRLQELDDFGWRAHNPSIKQ
jgi:hypothetical protein